MLYLRNRWFLGILLMISPIIYAQTQLNTYVIHQPVKDSLFLNDYVQIYYDPAEKLSIETVKNAPFVPFKAFKLDNYFFTKQSYNHWLRFRVQNTTDEDQPLLFDYGLYHSIELYDFNGKGYDIKKSGLLITPRQQLIKSNKFVIPTIILAHSTKEFYVRINDKSGIYRDSKVSLLTYHFEEILRSKSFFKSRSDIYYSASFLAVGLFLILFCLIQFSQTREKAFGYYALFLVAVYLYFLRRVEALSDIPIIFSYFPRFFLTSEVPLNILPAIWYLLFCQYLLDISPTNHPKIYRFFRWQIKFLTYYFFFDCILQYVFDQYAYSLRIYLWVRISLLLITFYGIILLFRMRNPVANYIASGTTILNVFLIISLTLAIIRRLAGEGFIYYVIRFPYVETGIFLENLLFIVAFVAKIKQVYRERDLTQRQLIVQLETNQNLQQRLNSELEVLVEQKTKALETETQQRIIAEFNQKLSQAELKSLQSQINPHFIFNSLNSVKNYILTNQPKEAARYLTDFANLIRSVLQQSQQSLISLKDELEILQIYVRLEQMRFENKFDFEYKVDNQIDINYLKVPALLLQPYVENAIWHGLMHKEEKGSLKIEVKMETPDEVLCLIEDDGVGRQHAAELQSQMGRTHKSLGLQINADRLKVLQELNELEISVEIIDLKKTNGESQGTRVIVHFPL